MFASVRSRRAARSAPEVNIAPLIDMVFILLIFFLVTTTFVREAGITVTRPQAASGESLESEALRAAIAASGQLYMDGRPVGLEALSAAVRKAVAEEGEAQVVVIPDEGVAAGRLVEVMDAARLAGAKEVAIATRKEGA